MNMVLIAVVPVFATVALGYGLAVAGLFGRDIGAALIRFMYYLAIPAMLFQSLAAADLPTQMPWAFLAAFYVPSVIIFAIGMLVAVRLLGWGRHEAGIAGMSASYSNMVLLGFPLSLNAFGALGAVPMFILLATQSTLIFPLTTWALEAAKRDRANGLRAHARTVLRLVLNPVILSLLLGVAANLGGLELPIVLERMLKLLSNAGPACALIALGISLASYKLGGGYRDVIAIVALKNFVHPACVWLGCIACGVESGWLKVAVLLAAMPVGLNAFIFSSQYGVRQEAVSKCIVVSTAVSSVVATLVLAQFL